MESTSRFYILLLLPILRGLLFSGGNLYIWLKGAWFDILIIAAIILLGYIRWYFYTVSYTHLNISRAKTRTEPCDAFSKASHAPLHASTKGCPALLRKRADWNAAT